MFDATLDAVSFRLKTMPHAFLPLARLRADSKKNVVTPRTDVAIEGFWRCGNHFATYAFIVAQSQPPRVAHHFHAPAQLMLAAKWGVPAILLIRNPVDAVASSAIYLKRDPRSILDLYNTFHRSLIPFLPKLVVSDFETTVNDFGSVIERVNQRFNRQFEIYSGSDESRLEVERRIREEHENRMGAEAERLPLPSQEKAKQKQAVLDRIGEARCAAPLREAQRLYEELRAAAVAELATSSR